MFSAILSIAVSICCDRINLNQKKFGMKLNPTLNNVERVANFLMGAGAIAYAFLGTIEHSWARAILVVLGILFLIGGIGGT